MGRQNTASSGCGANLRLPPITRPAPEAGFFVPGTRGGARRSKRRSLGDASEFLPFDDAASDTTDHFVGLVAQSADG